ncbi:hypothetical protein [Photobacterium damselae]
MLSRMMKCFILLIPLLIITGCGDAESDGNNNSIKTIAISTQDVVSYTQPKSLKTISLHNWVLAEGGEDVVINDVVPLDENCAISNIKELNFDVYNNSAGICRFKYTVKASSSDYAGVGNGIVQIVSSADYTEGNYLLPISRTVTESGTLSFDSDHLQIPDGFTIESVDLISDISSGDIGKISFTTHSIEYKAPSNTTGTERIFYSVVDHVNNTARPGIIYIAVGQDGNNNPIALDKVFPDQSIVKNNIDYPDGFDFSIDSLVSDVDGDNVQLVYASSNLGRITIHDNYLNYKTINTGPENIVYIVSDHNGGYGIGYIKFGVNTYSSIIDKDAGFSFTPPMTFNDVNSAGGIFTDTFEEKGIKGFAGSYPIFSASLAEAYCRSKGGTLPTTDEIRNMHEHILGKDSIFETNYKWHSGKRYLTENGSYDLSEFGSTAVDGSGYFSCVIELPESLSWHFSNSVYPAKLNEPVSIFIEAELRDGNKIFLPEDQYHLDTKITSVVYDDNMYTGIIPDDILSKVSISVRSNKVIIEDLSSSAGKLKSVSVEVSDPISTNKTKVVFGVTKCPNGTSFSQASKIGCIMSVRFNKVGPLSGPTHRFTLPLTTEVLQQFADQKDIDNLPGKLYKEGSLSLIIFHEVGVEWTKYRDVWIPTMDKICKRLNEFKIDGNTTWRGYFSGGERYSNGAPESKIKTKSEAQLVTDWYEWVADILPDRNIFRRPGFASIDTKSIPHKSYSWERQELNSDYSQGLEYEDNFKRVYAMPSCVTQD